MAELTADELKAMGFEVPGETTDVSLSPEEIAALGFDVPAEPVAPLPPPEVGAGETFVLRGAGAVPAGGLLSDLLGTAGVQLAKATGVGEPGAVLTPQAQAELYQQGLSEEEVKDPGNTLPGPVDVYRRLRDSRKLRTEVGSEQNPWAGRAGATTGLVASLLAPLPGVKFAPMRGIPLVAAERIARILSGAATGGAYGGFNGLTDGDADLTRGEVGAAAKETANRAAGGAVFGAAAAGAAEMARPAWERLREVAIRQGRRVIGGDSDIAAATRKELPEEAVEQVLRDKLIEPFGTTVSTYRNIDNASEQTGNLYAQILQRLEQLGVTGPRAESMAIQLMMRSDETRINTLSGNPSARVLRQTSRDIERSALGEQNLRLSVAEKLKRDAQKMGRHERLKNSPTEEAYQEIGSRLRQGIEDSVSEAGRVAPANSEVAQQAAQFRPVKKQLSNLLAARTVGERGASKALQKSSVGLKDMLFGATAGNPGTAALTALASSTARNRLPSAAASGTYALSEGLRTGSVSPELAKLLTLAMEPEITDTTQTLIDLLRKRDP